MRRCVLCLLLANPYFYATLHHFFYTPWELAFLTLVAWGCLRYFKAPKPARLVVALTPALLLVYTRALFHPLWLALLTIVLVLHARRAARRSWVRVAVAGTIVLILSMAWPMKNLVRFGFFGFSSWQGFNLSRGLPLRPSRNMALFAREAGDPFDTEVARALQAAVPEHFRHSGALTLLTKPDDFPNWNHYTVIGLSRECGATALAAVRTDPALLVHKALAGYLAGYSVYEARNPYGEGFVLGESRTAVHPTLLDTWARTYELVVMQAFRPGDAATTEVETGFAVLFPLAFFATAALLWRHRNEWTDADRVAGLMLFTIAWVLAMVVLVDGDEGNRMRFPTETFMFVAFGRLICRILDYRAGRAVSLSVRDL